MGGHNKLNLVGQRFSKLFVTDYSHSDERKERWYKCMCDCGNETIAKGSVLRYGNKKSCGCLRISEGRKAGLKSKIHGMIRTPTYNSWTSMKARCLNTEDDNYKFYGAKGVVVCEQWLDFQKFLEDMGERPEGTSLDRINPFGNYEPENCRWADAKTQLQNTRRNYNGEICQL